ncbi:uncharacterized protein LOC105695866 isoform X1 [Orussus abietinus]|uniref:uncharacterized protein LOC105695866 isoform X1 n=2 Tax=Orussus abietinus TaxID=222816 RepID=UPI0006255CCD|nr:uncharacterized protein LOC105695866 isoform X1 [Orussus abietinus]
MKHLLEAVIEDVIMEPNKIQPIIVNFQNGELKDEEAENMDCNLFYDERKKKTTLALSNGQVVYKGYKPNVDKELTYTMLAIHNKKTGKIRLVQAERWQVVPVLDTKLEIVEDTNTDKIAMLNKQFGSKRVKRRTEQFERMKVNVDSVKDRLEESVSRIEIERNDLSFKLNESSLTGNTSFPEPNREASDVADVYNMYEIVPKATLKTLYSEAKQILEDPGTGRSEYFMKTLEDLKTTTKNVKKVAVLLYMEAVSEWLKMLIKDAKKKGIEICPFSREVNNHVIETYSLPSANGRQRPASMRDKGVIHCIILALIISRFTLDLDLFSTLFHNKIGLKKLQDLSKIIGAVPLKGNKKIVILKIPLPVTSAVAKKSRRK